MGAGYPPHFNEWFPRDWFPVAAHPVYSIVMSFVAHFSRFSMVLLSALTCHARQWLSGDWFPAVPSRRLPICAICAAISPIFHFHYLNCTPTLFGGDLLLSDRLTAAAPRPIKLYSQHVTSLPQPLLLANLICSTADLLT